MLARGHPGQQATVGGTTGEGPTRTPGSTVVGLCARLSGETRSAVSPPVCHIRVRDCLPAVAASRSQRLALWWFSARLAWRERARRQGLSCPPRGVTDPSRGTRRRATPAPGAAQVRHTGQKPATSTTGSVNTGPRPLSMSPKTLLMPIARPICSPGVVSASRVSSGPLTPPRPAPIQPRASASQHHEPDTEHQQTRHLRLPAVGHAPAGEHKPRRHHCHRYEDTRTAL